MKSFVQTHPWGAAWEMCGSGSRALGAVRKGSREIEALISSTERHLQAGITQQLCASPRPAELGFLWGQDGWVVHLQGLG